MPLDPLFTRSGKLTRENWALVKGGPSSSEAAQFVMSLSGGMYWKLFHTATFRPSKCAVSPWEALERYCSFMHRPVFREITWVAAVEPNPDRTRLNPGFHVHAMWSAAGELYGSFSWEAKKRWERWWGHNQLTKVKSELYTHQYVAKYCVKGDCLLSWEIAGDVWRLREQIFSPSQNGGEKFGEVDPGVAAVPVANQDTREQSA